MSARLTDRQQEVYDLIRSLVSKRGYGPTLREIASQFEIKSPNGVICHLRALERKGLIKRRPNKSRAIELVQAADRNEHSLPMLGLVSAGPTSLAFEQRERVDFSELLFRDDRFILRVSGDSMIDAHIADGDYVIVQKQETANPGQMVVAQTPEGEATLKFWFPERNRIRLQPANESMDPIYVREAHVIGIAVGVVRSRI
jgi:repressor LexA